MGILFVRYYKSSIYCTIYPVSLSLRLYDYKLRTCPRTPGDPSQCWLTLVASNTETYIR